MTIKKAISEYLKLKQQERELKIKIRDVGDIVLEGMKELKMDEVERSDGSKIVLITSVRTKYPESVEREIKKIKEKAEKKGKVEFEPIEYLRVYNPK